MKTIYTKTVVLVAVVVMWFCVAGTMAEEIDQAGISPVYKHRPMVMSGEGMERMLSRIRQTNPEKAEELASLCEKDPNEFRKRLREHFRQEFGERRWDRKEQSRSGRGPRGGHQMMHPKGGRKGTLRERMWRRHTEFMNWLTENYPDQAKRLERLQRKNTNVYFEQLDLAMKTYRPIMRASRRNQELAEVLKKDLQLKEECLEVLADTKSATDKSEKERLKKQLEEIVADRFELLIKLKQIRYEELLQKLERIKEELRERKNEVDNLRSQKADNVKGRLEELLSGKEKIDWD
jgi:hypothetical protein